MRIQDYARYLELVVKRLKRTGAKLIWATTTPVPEGKVRPPRVPADVIVYKATARRVMEANGVAINDLYSFALSRLSEIQRPVKVHFTPSGSELLAKQVAKALEQALTC